MKHHFIIILAVTAVLLPPDIHADAGKRFEYLNQLFKAGAIDQFEQEQVDPDSLHEVFRERCLRLDSLLSAYSPYDTMSGRAGMETIRGIADCYTKLEIHDRSIKWWRLLRRVDDKGIFREAEYGGLLRAGIRTDDAAMVRGLLNSVEFWASSVKQSLGDELAAAMDYMIAEGADPDWLHERYTRLKRFLPEVRVNIIYFSILSGQGKWDEAYALIDALLQTLPAEDMNFRLAHFLFTGYVRASIMSGNFEDVEPVLRRSDEYTFGDISSRLRNLLPHLQFLKGNYGGSEQSYRKLCEEGNETGCFWADLLEKYREIFNYAR